MRSCNSAAVRVVIASTWARASCACRPRLPSSFLSCTSIGATVSCRYWAWSRSICSIVASALESWRSACCVRFFSPTRSISAACSWLRSVSTARHRSSAAHTASWRSSCMVHRASPLASRIDFFSSCTVEAWDMVLCASSSACLCRTAAARMVCCAFASSALRKATSSHRLSRPASNCTRRGRNAAAASSASAWPLTRRARSALSFLDAWSAFSAAVAAICIARSSSFWRTTSLPLVAFSSSSALASLVASCSALRAAAALVCAFSWAALRASIAWWLSASASASFCCSAVSLSCSVCVSCLSLAATSRSAPSCFSSQPARPLSLFTSSGNSMGLQACTSWGREASSRLRGEFDVAQYSSLDQACVVTEATAFTGGSVSCSAAAPFLRAGTLSAMPISSLRIAAPPSSCAQPLSSDGAGLRALPARFSHADLARSGGW
mmetsp:Transcript_44732/g.85524  ORF Transcript_44732/g.85524 Transcript_44732/m.85524 type:complete len:438 (+) Transcript_44732:692-2005(+)